MSSALAQQTTTTSSGLPSNDQIASISKEAERCLEETKKEEKRLNADGRAIIDTTEQLIADAQRFVDEKNPDDLIQRIIEEARRGGEAVSRNHQHWRKLHGAMKEFDTEEMKAKLTRFYDLSKLISIEMISSAEFRQSVFEFFNVLYAVLIDASKIDKIGQPLREALEAARAQAKPLVEEGKGAIKEKVGEATDDFSLQAEGSTQKYAGKAEFNAENTKQGGSDEIVEKLKQAGEQAIQRGLDLADPDIPAIQLSDEQIDQLLDQLNRVLSVISSRERSQRAFRALLDVWDIFQEATVNLIETAEKEADPANLKPSEKEHFLEAFQLTRELAENLTGRRMDTFVSHAKICMTALYKDEEWRTYFKRFGQFIETTIKDPQSLTSGVTRDEFKRFIQRGRDLFNRSEGGVRVSGRIMMEELREMMYALEDDPINQAIQCDIQRLAQLVLLDKKGNVTFKPEVLDQLRIIVTSLVVNRMRFPLPPLSFDDKETLEFTVTGLVINIRDLLPKRIIAQNSGLAIVDLSEPEKPEVERAAESVRIILKNINIHIPDAYIKFNHKVFPKVVDEGFAHIDIGGTGMDLALLLRGAVGTNRWFTLARTECLIHDLSLKFEGTKHDTIYNTLVTLFKPRIKQHIENAVQESMISVFESLNDQIELQVKRLQVTMSDVVSDVKDKAVEVGSNVVNTIATATKQ